jgi:hypothetical protein
LEVLTVDADGEEPRSVGRRVVDALLEAEDVRVEVERPVLVADEHGCVEDLVEHCYLQEFVVTTTDKWRRANVTGDDEISSGRVSGRFD